ncbi:unnamed protein product [Larinioides sclopetarius]|uniref:Ribosomal protein L32 n=1 Tax=Larinioides sclopetarius TaxID=280406 RepID=A0AAV1Z1B7_9ARAC
MCQMIRGFEIVKRSFNWTVKSFTTGKCANFFCEKVLLYGGL